MKKLMLLFLACLTGMAANAAGDPDFSYIVTKSGTIYCENVTKGVFRFHAILYTGERVTFQIDSVLAYRKNERTFERMPIYCHGNDIGNTAFMEVIACRDGFKLYRFKCSMPGSLEVTMPWLNDGTACCKLLVFKNNKYQYELDETNLKEVFIFFRLDLKA